MRSMMLALIAALLFVPAAAMAENGEAGDWELGIFGGYGWLDDYDDFFRPEDNFLYGARLGYWFSHRLSLEASAQRLPTETDFDIIGLADRDMDLDALRLNALYSFAPGARVRPFLTAGVGLEETDVEDFGESTDLSVNAGGGIRFFVSPNVNLRLDGRYVRFKVGGELDECVDNFEAAFGIGLLFGGRGDEEAIASPAPSAPTEEVRHAEAVSCLAGGFPRNLSRLNNVDKACLDDVAQRLRTDPRARVVVIGHADPGETSPARIGESRAAAVRSYFVDERGIDATRISVRSVGSDRPLGSNVAANRRVEVWFVPQGASIPD